MRFRTETSPEERANVLRPLGGRRHALLGESGLERVTFSSATNFNNAAAVIRNNPSVEFVEPNYLIKANEIVPDDPQFAEQWVLRNTNGGEQNGSDIGATRAWEATTGAERTIIAVIDSGINFSHPDLRVNQWTNQADQRNNKDDDENGLTDDTQGWDWVAQSNIIRDEAGHGTAIAGIIAAHGNNKVGIAGVMWRAGLMSLRVLDATGTGDVAQAVEAIDYAVAHGAHVINCSWGTESASRALAEAIERAGKRGVLVIASAGNNSSNIDAAPQYPASYSYPHVISVASTDRFDQLTSWSNWGTTYATIAAPGVEILSTKMEGGYERVSGSSASTALVTGVAGLIKTLRPRLKAQSVKAMLINGARPRAALNGKVSTGGILSAAGSVVATKSLAANEGEEESSENPTSDAPQGNNSSMGLQAGANESSSHGHRVTPSFEVSDLPDLNQLRRVSPRAPRAVKPIPSTSRRHQPSHLHNNSNGRRPNGDTGTIALQSTAGDISGHENMTAKYFSPPRQVLIAANRPQAHDAFRLPLLEYFEGRAAATSTSDAPDTLAWSYSARTDNADSEWSQRDAQQQSIEDLIARLGSFSGMLMRSMPAIYTANDAAFLSQTVPGEMIAGQPYIVTVKMQNTGSTAWTASESYRLGSQFPQDNSTWGLGRAGLPGSVAPGQEATFTFQVTAPATPGLYHFQWRMVRDGYEWFGQHTANIPIIVNSNAAFVSQTIPTVMQAGQTYPVSVTMMNTSSVTWTAETLYRLGARNPQDNSIWGTNSSRTPLPSTVASNQQVTFNFNVTAPAAPGVYNFQRQMVKDGLGWFGVMTPNVAVNVTADGTFTPTPQGNVIVSEFRFRGMGGALDEFVELYNNTNAPITVGTEDGSDSWSLVAFDLSSGLASTIFTVPAGTVIPARGHFLAVGQAYSLSGYAEADFAYIKDITDNAGIALFRTATPANFTLANRLDAVGFNNVSNTLFYEGTGLTPISSDNGQYSFYRKLGSGTPQDTGSNATDFMFVSTTAGAYGRPGTSGDQVNGPSVLGAPGPENVNSPVNRNGVIPSSMLDPLQASSNNPNRVYGSIPNPYGTGTLSTMMLRRRFTNNTGAPVTKLRFRLVDTTTLNSQVFYTSQADLRAMSAPDVQVTLTDGTLIPVQGATLEEPPAQASHGGGMNATLKIGTITTSVPLAPGASVNMQFQLGIVRGGSYRFLINVEALPQATVGAAEPPTAQDFAVARLDPANRTGEEGVDLRSGNYHWSLPLVSLPGRSGLDLGLALVYNSRVWTKSGSSILFDADYGKPSPGFRLGFSVIQPRYFNSQTQKNAYLLVTPAGEHVELRQTATPNVYESADSSYLQLTEAGLGLILRPMDGSQLTFSWQNGEYQCTEIKDRNGNYITVAYDALGQLQTIRDTLAREINFLYDSNQNLNKITQTRNGVEHVWASFGWGQQTIRTNFTGLSIVGLENGSTIPVLTQVGLADGSLYRFDYTTWGQVNRISRYTLTSDAPPVNPQFPADYTIRAYSAHFLRFDNGGETDCPRVQARSEWAEHWNGGSEAVTSYSYDASGAWGQAISPEGTRYVEDFGSGWRRGLVVGTKIYEQANQGTPVKSTSNTWTQDDENLQYVLNPRVVAADVNDKEGNYRHIEIGYTSYGLTQEVKEYNGAVVLRRSLTNYNLNAAYTDATHNRRLIGLVAEQSVYGLDPADNTEKLYSRVTYDYDAGGEFLVNQGEATQHDPAFNASLNVRGNLTSVRRWDVSQSNVSVASTIGYNTNGSVIFTRDPMWTLENNRQVTVSYADAFLDSAAQPNLFNPFAPNAANTFAYPTTITDADGYKSFSKYDYHLGVARQVQSPPANSTSTTDHNGPVLTTSYDAAGRKTKIVNSFNAAQTLLVYPASLTSTFVKTKFKAEQTTEDQFMRTFKILDGAGRVRATSSDFDPARQIYSGQKMVYDKMGRLVNESNQTAITSGWAPADEDGTTNWVYTAQQYDWQGRPTIFIDADGTTTEKQYGGCGCAGEQIITVRDSMGRRSRVYTDVLGRQVKTEQLNTDGSIYRTAQNTFNALDQVTRVLTQGTTGASQETSMTYDGYGRLKTRKTPIQTSATTHSYNPDDSLQSITDARGATKAISYNNRGLATSITYSAPSGMIPTGPVTFSYDAAGNRLSMDDAAGRVDYQYSMLSQLTAETRQFEGLAGSYTLSYSYNLGGQVASITDPAGAVIMYGYNEVGRLKDVTGTTFAGVTQYATGMQYRAFGALKSLTYGNNSTLTQGFDTRLRLTSLQVGTMISANFQYYYDGRVRYAKDNLNPVMDRAYNYDHVGRISEGLSGTEARDFVNGTQTGAADGIYRQSYQYDIWDNLTGRAVNRFWSGNNPSGNIYVNQRRQGSLYDAEGNELYDNYGVDGRRHSYDAAGHKVSTRERSKSSSTALLSSSLITGDDQIPPGGHYTTTTITLTQTYDGDGLSTKRAQERVMSTPNYVPVRAEAIDYYVRSSVFGGKVITELSNAGQKRKTMVYAGDELVAEQNEFGGGAQYLTWKQRNPITGTQVELNTSNQYSQKKEYDPFGLELGESDPYANNNEPDYASFGTGSFYRSGGNPFDGGGGCTIDRMPGSCSEARWLLSVGMANQCVDNDCGAQTVTVTTIGRDGQVVGTSTVLRAPGQPGWNGSLDGTYNVVTPRPIVITQLPNFARDFLRDAARAGKDIFELGDAAFRRELSLNAAFAGSTKDNAEYKRNLTEREWKGLEPIFALTRRAIAIQSCADWLRSGSKWAKADPLQTLESLISKRHFFYGGKPGSIATTYPSSVGVVTDSWVGLRAVFFQQTPLDRVETILHELRHVLSNGMLQHPENFNNNDEMTAHLLAGGGIETQEGFSRDVEKNCIAPLRQAMREK